MRKLPIEDKKANRKESQRKWREANKQYQKKWLLDNKSYHIEYGRTFEGLTIRIFNTQKRNSKKRSHPVPTYTLIELQNWIKEQPNYDLLMNNWIESGYLKELVPSVDRLIDSEGYSLTNIQLVTWSENNKRGNLNRRAVKKINK